MCFIQERQMLFYLLVYFTEKASLVRGRPQFTKPIISKPGLCRWIGDKALDQKLSSVIKFNNHEELL